jgi:hypothetical protein
MHFYLSFQFIFIFQFQPTTTRSLIAFEAAYLFGEKTVITAIIESVLSKQIDDLEPTLTRHGYDVRGLAEQFNAKPAEIKLLFRGQLDPARSRELHEQMLAAGLPL